MVFLETVSISPWISILISSFSLFATLVVAYVTNFKRAKPGVLIGSSIAIYPAPFQTANEIIEGVTAFIVPMTFFNWSPNGESIVDCRINISRIENSNEIYDMPWYEFLQMLQSERKMGYAGKAQPIPLPPKSSLTKSIQFIWTPRSEKKMKIIQGQYTLNVLIWTKVSLKPDIRESFEFSISEEDAANFQTNMTNMTTLTIDVSIQSTNRGGCILTKEQANKIYG